MSGPPRLRNPESGAPPLLREWLADARPSRPMDEMEASRLLSSVRRSVANERPGSGVRAWSRALAWAGGLVLVAAGTSYGFDWLAHRNAQKEPTPSRTLGPFAPLDGPETFDEDLSPPSEEAASERSHSMTESNISAREPRRRGAPERRGETDSPDPLAREIALLQEAQALLARSPGRTLRKAEQHARDFPNGQLTVERELLAIEALVRSGREPAARRRAARFASEPGREAYDARLRSILALMNADDEGGPTSE